MKYLIVFSLLTVLLIGCNKDENNGDPTVCVNQSMDFQSCLSCCQSNGFSGASLPIDDNGNTLECECVN
ncbi:MAG: hypothetical protein JJT77_10020 [Crocinitomicaceae bacterium]|nr:hypothetical protein [Crocinitomicaceae bacterium]